MDRIARTTDNQRRLRELAFAYADIADVPISALRWDDVVLDRTNGRWRELFNLARLLLGERFQTTSAGTSQGGRRRSPWSPCGRPCEAWRG